MVFLDCRFIERKGATPSKTKLVVNEEELLINAVKKAVGKFVNGTATEDVEGVFNRITSVMCNGSNLTEFMIDDPDFTLHGMNSTDTPIFKMGIDIALKSVEPESTTTKKKTKIVDAQALFMKEVQLDLRYLKMKEKDIDKEPEVDEQILWEAAWTFGEPQIMVEGPGTPVTLLDVPNNLYTPTRQRERSLRTRPNMESTLTGYTLASRTQRYSSLHYTSRSGPIELLKQSPVSYITITLTYDQDTYISCWFVLARWVVTPP